MGILDDLKSQADQKNKPVGEQPTSADAEEFYRTHVKQRMLMANDFFTQLVNQLNEMKLVIKAEYPFRPEGKKVTLLQQGYKAYSDHITDPRQVTLSFTCILANPATYDVRDRGPALAQGELLDRYHFKYEKMEARDQNQMIIGARFKLQGPLQIKCILQFDAAKQIIKLLLTNFIGPGTSQYNLKPEHLDEAFMDRLGKYLLRKEAKLFQEEISDDAKAMLRKRLQQEQMQREAELRAIEEQRKAEEAARKQNSTTEQLKKAVSQSVAENREKLKKVMDEQVRAKGEKLKTMFSKLKNRASNETTPEQTAAPPAANTSQTARPTGTPPVQGLPPVNRQAGQAASGQQNAPRPKPSADQKTPTPPKVFQSSASNPFLKPEDFEPVPRDDEEQTEDNAGMATPATAKTPGPITSPASAPVTSEAEASASAAKTDNPFLQTKAAAARAETKKPAGQSPAQTATPATPTTKPAGPSMQAKAAAFQAGTKEPTIQSPVQAATPASQSPTTSAVAEATPIAAENASVANASNPPMQTPPPAAPGEPELSLEPTASEPESSSAAAPLTPELSLEPATSAPESSSATAPLEAELPQEPTTSAPESSSAAAPFEPELSLAPAASAPESTSAAAPLEPELSLEPTASDSESSTAAAPLTPELSLEAPAPESGSSSPVAPLEPERALEPTASESISSSMATKSEPPAEPPSDRLSLSLEDELERDLARFMEHDQLPPSREEETSGDPDSMSDELDFDLSSPDALEIHFEDKGKTKGSE